MTLESREHLITDAGQIAPGFSDSDDKVEFFVHSPFASRLDGEEELLDRNTDSLVLHASFRIEQTITRVFFGSDIDHEALDEIVRITCLKKREGRLDSDIVKLPHHCSYLSLSGEKGKDKTTPTKNVGLLLREEASELSNSRVHKQSGRRKTLSSRHTARLQLITRSSARR